jgi:molybdenum cofactor guanylyltransferase
MGGRPKSFLTVGGERIIDRQLRVLRAAFDEILISANDREAYAAFGLPVLPDELEARGPLGGILAAIEGARADRVVCVACDMPYLSREALALLVDVNVNVDVVVPVVDNRPEPLFARYSRRCAPAIRKRIAAGDLKITRFFDDVTVQRIEEPALRAVDPTLRFLVNCNTPEDLK